MKTLFERLVPKQGWRIAIGIFAMYFAMWLIAFLLFGCSKEYHFSKFIKKGGTIETVIKLVEVKDTIRINGKDSIITLHIPVTCPEVVVPEPKWKTKLIYRENRKSEKLIYNYKIQIEKLKAKTAIRENQFALMKLKLENKLKLAAEKTKRVENRQETKQKKSLWYMYMILGAFVYQTIILLWRIGRVYLDNRFNV